MKSVAKTAAGIIPAFFVAAARRRCGEEEGIEDVAGRMKDESGERGCSAARLCTHAAGEIRGSLSLS